MSVSSQPPWGKPTTATHNGVLDLGFRFLYVGRFDVQWDDALGLGLAYMHARHYSPAIGRFLQPDPARAEPNGYSYAASGPISKADPAGHCWQLVGGGLILAPESGGISAGVGGILFVGCVGMGLFGLWTTTATATKVIHDNWWSDIKVRPSRAAISQAHAHLDDLPRNGGDFPYRAPRGKGGKTTPVWDSARHGFRDKSGNLWKWDKSGHRGPHWDVQLRVPKGKHVNVDTKGKVLKPGGKGKAPS